MLGDKEVLLTYLNIKAMSFSGTGNDNDDDDDEEDEDITEAEDVIKENGGPSNSRDRNNSIVRQLVGKKKFKRPTITMVVDLAFASNVRFLDDHELHLDNVELYRVRLPDMTVDYFPISYAWPIFA